MLVEVGVMEYKREGEREEEGEIEEEDGTMVVTA